MADDDGEHGRRREEELGIGEVDEGDVVVQFPHSGDLEVDPSSGAASRCCHDARQCFSYFSSGNKGLKGRGRRREGEEEAS
jgi:hypothetical protein